MKSGIQMLNVKVIAGTLGCIGLLFFGGCAIGGAVLAPTNSEKQVPAEYNLKGSKDKVMVIAEEARSSSAGFNFQSQLAEGVSAYLVKKVRLKSDNIILESDSKASQGVVELSGVSPSVIGKKAGADLALFVRIERYELVQMDKSGMCRGLLYTQSVLFDCESGAAVWPGDGQPRLVRVRIDLEKGGRETTMEQLVRATAHCITRHLYNCPVDQYRSGYEATEFKLNDM